MRHKPKKSYDQASSSGAAGVNEANRSAEDIAAIGTATKRKEEIEGIFTAQVNSAKSTKSKISEWSRPS